MKLTIKIPTQLSVVEAWSRLTDWRAHAQWIPLTKMIILNEGAKPGLGDKFIGRTGLGPIAFDDVMTVTAFEAPGSFGYCEVTKTGRLVKGSAAFRVDSDGASAVVTWEEDIVLPKVIEPMLAPLLKRIGVMVFTAALKKALAQN